MKRLSLCVLLMLAGPVFADPPALDIPATVKAPSSGYLTLKPKTDAVSIVYVAPGLDPFPSEFLSDKLVLIVPVRGLAPGSYACTAVAASKAGEQRRVDFVVVVGNGHPPPPGPVPPGPVPPIGTFNRVLIVYETSTPLPEPQQGIIFGKAVRDALRAKTKTDADNPGGAFRIYDKDVDLSGEQKAWQDLMARPRTSNPWLVFANDAGVVYEGPLPKDATEMLALMAKYGPKGGPK